MRPALICTEQGKRLHIGIIEKGRWRAICGISPAVNDRWAVPGSWLARGKSVNPTAKGRCRSICRSCVAATEFAVRLVASTEAKP